MRDAHDAQERPPRTGSFMRKPNGAYQIDPPSQRRSSQPLNCSHVDEAQQMTLGRSGHIWMRRHTFYGLLCRENRRITSQLPVYRNSNPARIIVPPINVAAGIRSFQMSQTHSGLQIGSKSGISAAS